MYNLFWLSGPSIIPFPYPFVIVKPTQISIGCGILYVMTMSISSHVVWNTDICVYDIKIVLIIKYNLIHPASKYVL